MSSSTSAESIDFTDFSLKMKLAVWTEKTDTCWNWVGTISSVGYGRFKYRAAGYLAHRVAWAFANQVDPAEMMVDHMCHTPACVNPEHLRLATRKQNAENMLPVRAKSGFRGVYRHRDKWRAAVKHDGVQHYSASLDTPEAANMAAIAMRNRLYTHNILDRHAV